MTAFDPKRTFAKRQMDADFLGDLARSHQVHPVRSGGAGVPFQTPIRYLGAMRRTPSLSVLAGASLLLFSTTSNSTGIELHGPSFKTGHPMKGERIESAVIGETEIASLKRTVDILGRYPSTQFEVTGHTDQSECSGQECHDLALRRALLVYRFLLDAGVDAHRVISLTEYASTRPIAGRREEYQLNQRAEINIMFDP